MPPHRERYAGESTRRQHPPQQVIGTSTAVIRTRFRLTFSEGFSRRAARADVARLTVAFLLQSLLFRQRRRARCMIFYRCNDVGTVMKRGEGTPFAKSGVFRADDALSIREMVDVRPLPPACYATSSGHAREPPAAKPIAAATPTFGRSGMPAAGRSERPPESYTPARGRFPRPEFLPDRPGETP